MSEQTSTPRDFERAWSTDRLELYHDQALAPDEREQLTRALRGSSDLRRRLQQIINVDQLTRSALLCDTRVSSARDISLAARRRSGVRRGLTLIAAGLAAAALLWVAFGLGGNAATRAQGPELVRRVEADTPYRPIRLMLEVSIPRASREKTAEAHAKRPISPRPDSAASSRAQGFADLGRAAASVQQAKGWLDQLSPEQQLEASAVWVREPSLRVLALRRLGELSGESELQESWTRVVQGLWRERELQPWLREYRVRRQARDGSG